MPMMQMPRNWTVRTASGHTLKFEKATPLYVPDDMLVLDACLAAGAEYVDKEQAAPRPDEGIVTNLPKTTQERTDRINALMREMAANQPEHRQHFTAYGRPSAKYAASALGFDVSAREIEVLWGEITTPKTEAA